MKKLTSLFAFCLAAWLTTPADAQSNTMIRFRISYDRTLVGNIDVELFDQEKPVTVSNFLSYVRSGAYLHTILHRASPNTGPTILQGGGLRVANPYSTDQFTCVDYVPTNAPIVNEFTNGTPRSNTYGTLAMAKEDGAPDSATSSWFFNMGDNSASLDTNNGGYTVFGRVVGKGTNVLNNFRQIRPGRNMVDPAALNFFCSSTPYLEELPVAYAGYACPTFSSLFTVQIIELGKADTTIPTLVLKTPLSNARVSNDTVTVTGTAADKTGTFAGVSNVWCYLNNCLQQVAVGTTNWTVTLTNVPPGTNVIRVESVDAAGNHSTVSKRTFFRYLPWAFGRTNVGLGTITGPTNGQILEVGRNYSLSAKPAKGFLFSEWTGTRVIDTNTYEGSSTSPAIYFQMESNLTFAATFVTNFYPQLKGTYTGLYYLERSTNTGVITEKHDTSGFIKIDVTEFGKFTGSLRLRSKSYKFSGTLSPGSGQAIARTKVGASTLEISLNLNLTNLADFITGYVTDNATWTSYYTANRVHTGTKANPSPFKGTYTLVIPGTNDPALPAGDGFGRAVVSEKGTVSFSGTLADGTPVTQGVAVSTNGMWPLQIPLYSGAGSILSWIKFDTNQPGHDLSSTLYWFNPANPKSKAYTNAFTFTTTTLGSIFRAPASSTNRVLEFTDGTNGIATFTDGILATPPTNGIILKPKSIVANPSTNKLTFKLTSTTGLFSGSVTPTNTTKAVTFKGVALQKQNYASGYFLRTTNQSGRIYLGPQP